MPYSSTKFLGFKWWRIPGVDAAVWFCHNMDVASNPSTQLTRTIQDLDDRLLSSWLISVFNIGKPSAFSRVISGIENIWVTAQSITKHSEDGHFPNYFQNRQNLKVTGIIINTVDGSDRPDRKLSDYCLDIIVTFTSSNSIPPIYHRERIPQWTSTQRSTIGRYTTGPLTTVWSKI